MKKNVRVLIIISAILVLLSGQIYADTSDKKITLVIPREQNTFLGKWLNMIYTEAFKRLGMELVYQYTSPKRCSILSDSGEVDGEFWRVYDYNNAHPNLIRVEESPFSNRFCAYAVSDIKLDGWESLNN